MRAKLVVLNKLHTEVYRRSKGMALRSTKKSDFDLYIRVGINQIQIFSMIYDGNILQCYAFLKEMISKFKNEYSSKWNKRVHFLGTISAKFESGEKQETWLLYEHAPEHNRFVKRASPKFKKKLSEVKNG